MSARWHICGVMLAALTVAAIAAPPDDDQLLKSARIGSDGPALLAYFRQRTVTDADRQRIETLIRQLGDPAYAVRERAAADLVACGLPAIGPLRLAQADADVEVARRAERCLERIERVPSTALSAAAARAVARIKPPPAGAVGVLLAYLPVADDEGVADEVREALAAVAKVNGQPDPLLAPTLDDPSPVKRGAAAEALVRTGLPAAIEVSRKALADGSADVRVRTALALVTHAKDKKAVPALIGLLAELPQGAGWRIEDVLVRLAGEDAPPATLGVDDAARQKCRDAWLAWWEKNAATTDLAKLDGTPPMIGHTLLVLRDQRSGMGKVLELNVKKEIVWKIEGLQMPIDAVMAGRDHVIIVEQNNHQVSERDLTGKVIWRKQVLMPSCVQRLANGNTFIVARNQLVELDGVKHDVVFTHARAQTDIIAGQKLRNGEMVFVTTSGACVRLDAKGKEIKTFQVGRMYYSYGGLEVLANGHVLVTQKDMVAEYDGIGVAPVWHATVNRPTSVQRLPNGNTLVASGLMANTACVELDRDGHQVWDYKPPDGALPWRAKRR